MKIKKELQESIKLTEAEDAIELDNSTEEVAAEIKDQADEAEVPMTADAAEEAAEETKELGDKIEADEVIVVDDNAPLEVKNKLTRALDKALKANLGYREDGINEVANVLVTGLPGSSKTASVYNWAARTTVSGAKLDRDTPESDKIHITYLNAKNNDIDAFINGYTVQDPNDQLTVRQAVSHNLDGLDRPNSVLFLDEYNRQTKQQIRASLLTLINEHYVTGKEEDGKHYFKNFLFTVAAVNPAGTDEDEGAAMLNDAERTRFLYKVKDFDSNPEVTQDYLENFYVTRAKKEAQKLNPNMRRIEKFLRIWHLGRFICSHPDFEYDNKSVLNKLYAEQATMLNQRSLTAALAATQGNPDDLRDYIDNDADFLKPTAEMLDGILSDYTEPTLQALFRAANMTDISDNQAVPVNGEVAEPETDTDVEDNTANEPEEDDDDFFTGGVKTAAGKTIKTAAEVSKAIDDAILGWG